MSPLLFSVYAMNSSELYAGTYDINFFYKLSRERTFRHFFWLEAQLDRRASKMLANMLKLPWGSILQDCFGPGKINAAYRLIEREDLDYHDFIATHWDNALQRMAHQAVVLCIQDTAGLNFNDRQTQAF